MKFQNLLQELKQLNLPNGQYVVVSSGSLDIRGIRAARDLDVLTSAQLWEKLAQKYKIENDHGMNKIKLTEGIEILGEGSAFRDPNIASVEEIIETADVIEGVRYINLPLLKKFKQKMGREKDLKDIELIDQYLSSALNNRKDSH